MRMKSVGAYVAQAFVPVLSLPEMDQIEILNVPICNVSSLTLLERLRLGGVVFTPNVDHLVKLQHDWEFYQAYQSADYRVCDSQIVVYASRFLGVPIREKISGSDFFPAFYRYYKDDTSVRIFLLGAAPGVAEQARQSINEKVGREMVVGCYSPPFGFEQDGVECSRIVELIEASGATVLAVGLGAPKQEKWICAYKNRLKQVKVFLAVGATIDFEAGCLQRSPKWMSQLGVEWAYRLLTEPKRLWKRYLVDDVVFFGLILRQRLTCYRNPFVQTVAGSATPLEETSA